VLVSEIARAQNLTFQARNQHLVPMTKALWERSQYAAKVARTVLKQRRGRRLPRRLYQKHRKISSACRRF